MSPLADSKPWLKGWPGPCITLISLVFTAGCGRATSTEAEPKSAPAAAATPGATSLEQAEAELEQARAELEQAQAELEQASLSREALPAAGAAESTAAPAPPARAPTAPKATMPAAPAAEAEAARPEPPREAQKKAASDIADTDRDASSTSGAAATPLSSCERSCKAFGSLKRARDAICRLDEQGGARCSRADGVVRDAEGKIQSCGCPR